jgi:mitogen-activated protein kinase kinase kinase 13
MDPTGNAPPKSVVVIPPVRTKKRTHRRVGSGGGLSSMSPKSSPARDRKIQSEPESSRLVKLVDSETQTDTTMMDISEPDLSPLPQNSSRQFGQRAVLHQRDGVSKVEVIPFGKARTNSMSRSRIVDDEDVQNEADNELEPSSSDPISQSLSDNGNPMTNSDIMVHSDILTRSDMTRSDMTRSDMTHSDMTSSYRDACSSPDLLDDVMNSNERLDYRDCSDDDHLDALGRKVSEFITENRLSIHSNHSDNGNMNTVISNRGCSNETNDLKSMSTTTTTHDNGTTTTTVTTTCRNANNYTLGQGNFYTKDLNNCESRCEDSWTDEEGEEPNECNYSLRRRR